MKAKWLVILALAGLVLSSSIHAHADDLSAQIEAALQTDPLPAAEVPPVGMFYLASDPTRPPLPCNLQQLSAWNLGNNNWLLDDVDEDTGFHSMMGRSMADDVPSPGDGADSGGDGYYTNYPSGGTPIDTNGLYLEITNVSNGWSYLNLHNATNEVYSIWSTTNLATPFSSWNVEMELWPTGDQTNVIPVSVPNLERNPLFLKAEDWTGVDSNGGGIPDWWIWKYFGDLSETSTNFDSQGNTLGNDYANGIDPNVISFTVRLGNQNFNTTTATGTYLVLGGTPSYAAILVNDTNFNDAVWLPYDGNISMSLGSTDGVYQVQFGLKGRADDSQVTWMGTAVTLNRSTPQITLTSLTNGVVAQPWLQLQGYASMPLAKVTYDFNGLTNQLGFIIRHTLDTNTLSYTTDYFQCYDIPLAEGSNSISIHATDPAGNTFTTNLNVTLDYSTATNPVVKLIWPSNGMELCGSNFTVRGWTEDAAAQISATITDSNGDTNIITGMVERTGNAWVENLPLNAGTNFVTLSVTNAAGLSSATNFMVVKSGMTLTLDNITGDLWLPTVSVNGSISDSSAAITVNGVQGTNNGDGTWSADKVLVSVGGIASFEVNATPTNSGDPAIILNAVKPDELKLDSCTWHYEKMDDVGTVHQSGTLGWTSQDGGFEHDEFHPNTASYTGDSTIAPDGSVSLTHYTDSYGADYYTTNSGMADLPWSYGTLAGLADLVVNGSNILFATFKNSGTAKVFYHTGGQQIAGSESLYEVSGGYLTEEQAEPGQPHGGFSGDGIVSADVPPPQPVVAGFGENLDTNRTAYQVLPNPPQVEETLQAGVPSAGFVQQGARYKPVISWTGGAVITNTQNVVVGQKMSLTCGWDKTDGPTITNFQWTVSGYAISNFYISADALQTNGHPASFTLKTNSEVDFYWVDGGSKQITCTVITANGQTLTAKADFNVKKPNGTLTAYISGSVQVYYNKLIFGGFFAGIEFFKNDLDTDGDWKLVQIGSQTFRYEDFPTNGGAWDRGEGSGLDTAYPYPIVEESDSPSTTLESYIYKVTGSGAFTTYLTFKPNQDDAIRIPIRKINWDWSGAATNDNGVWTGSGTQNVDSADSPATSTISWTDNIIRTLNNPHPE